MDTQCFFCKDAGMAETMLQGLEAQELSLKQGKGEEYKSFDVFCPLIKQIKSEKGPRVLRRIFGANTVHLPAAGGFCPTRAADTSLTAVYRDLLAPRLWHGRSVGRPAHQHMKNGCN